ncbi:portal protein [Chromobacterium haemolyticum]|uniref:portal protein n=1 Tax=Chromobacterium TaxID=535 RepID=UPI004055A20B
MASAKLKPITGAAKLYDNLKSKREPYIKRGRENAKITLALALKEEGKDGNADFDDNQQSLGALGVNSLASKLTSALLPPGVPFFSLQPDHPTMLALAGEPDKKADVDAELSRMEQTANTYVETTQIRVTTVEGMRQLIIVGNALMFMPPESEGVRLYKLPSYVVQRDSIGNVLHIIAVDSVAYMALPEELKPAVKNINQDDPTEEVLVYTHVQRLGDEWYSYQEIEGELIKGTENTYPLNACPWIPLRMTKEDGEAYGRAYVDDYRADLVTISKLSKALNDLAGAAARVLYGVEPTYQGSLKKLTQTRNGGFTMARKGEIYSIQLDKQSDMQTANWQLERVERRIERAFLLNSSIQRNAERVTAEEIRMMAAELEELLGGLYSLLTQEFQLPLARRILSILEELGKVPALPEGIVEPTVTTGVEALGRGQKLIKYQTFLNVIAALPGALGSIKTNVLITAIGNACDVDTSEFVMTEEEIQQQQEARNQQELMMKGAPGIASGIGGAMRDGVADGSLQMGTVDDVQQAM